MTAQDEVYGLPFLFTGGLPTSLDKFTEGNLRCFIIYLIEVVAKANRLNVWKKPPWWNTSLIPYSPLEVDTVNVPPSNVVEVLRDLVESCYKYYHAEKILDVSKQLAELPRVLLRVKDNGNNTKTLYDANSNTVYVTVRPENLTYDEGSLNKVSRHWRENYRKEDAAFCEIKRYSSEVDYRKQGSESAFLSQSSSGTPTATVKPMQFSRNLNDFNMARPNLDVIMVIDSDDEGTGEKQKIEDTSELNEASKIGVIEVSDSDQEQSDDDKDDVEFLGVARFDKLHSDKRRDLKKIQIPTVILLSDSEDDCSNKENENKTSPLLVRNLGLDSPGKKSILEPLHRATKGVPINAFSQSCESQLTVKSRLRHSTQIHTVVISDSETEGEEESRILPKKRSQSKEELGTEWQASQDYSLRPRTRRGTSSIPLPFPPSPPPSPTRALSFKSLTKDSFLEILDLNREAEGAVKRKKKNQDLDTDLISSLSKFSSWTKMPLEWLRLLAGHTDALFVSRRGQKFCSSNSDYEKYCSTNKAIVSYNINLINSLYDSLLDLKNRKDEKHKIARPLLSSTIRGEISTLERWNQLDQESSKRRRRAAARMIRSCMGDSPSLLEIKETLKNASLVPYVLQLPLNVLEIALRHSVPMKKPL